MSCAISLRDFPKVVNDLERLHFSSNVQSVFKKESNTNPALIVKIMEAVPRNQRVRNGTQEETLIRGGDPLALLKYMELMDIGEWPAAEDALASSVKSAIGYVEQIGNKPFPKGEPQIATQANLAFWYATEVLKTRFPAGEPAIKTRPRIWQAYVEELEETGQEVPEDDSDDYFAHTDQPKRRP
jgi:hypothetical protein